VPIVAVMAVVLLGAAALATDLSVNTSFRRNIQNVTDAAALAGATRLQTSPMTQANRTQGALDALAVMYDRLGFPIGGGSSTTYFTGLVNSACPSNSDHCTVTLTAGAYSMMVAAPPISASNSAYNGVDQYLETKIVETSNNGIAGVLGQGTSTESGHSVAYHSTPSTPFGFALYAQQYVQSGNASEVVSGNIYASQYLDPQSSGQASICAEGGSIVLGAPQHPNEPSGWDTQATHVPMPPSARQVSFVSDCTNASGGQVAQTQPKGCNDISGMTMSSTSYVDDANYSQTVPAGITVGSTLACVANPAISAPVLTGPPLPWSTSNPPPTYNCGVGNTGLVNGEYQPGLYTCPLTVDHPLAPGFYEIEHKHNSGGYDVTIGQNVTSSCSASELAQGFTVCLDGVTFYGVLNSFNEAPSIDVTSKVVVDQTPACSTPRASESDCVFPIYSPVGVPMTVTTDNLGTVYGLQGSMYMPSGTVTINTNSRITMVGQAIVQQWSDQSGFHPDPSIVYNKSVIADLQEQLRLVE